jgi:hypothetical protein
MQKEIGKNKRQENQKNINKENNPPGSEFFKH